MCHTLFSSLTVENSKKETRLNIFFYNFIIVVLKFISQQGSFYPKITSRKSIIDTPGRLFSHNINYWWATRGGHTTGNLSLSLFILFKFTCVVIFYQGNCIHKFIIKKRLLIGRRYFDLFVLKAKKYYTGSVTRVYCFKMFVDVC